MNRPQYRSIQVSTVGKWFLAMVMPVAWLGFSAALRAEEIAPGPLAANALDPAAGLLLHWEIATEEFGESSTGEYLIYRDGLVVASSPPSSNSPFVIYARAAADPAALVRLKVALTENHVGLIRADPDCRAMNPFPQTVTYSAQLTWFGRNGRQNRLTFSSLGTSGTLCPTEINNLLLAIEPGFLANVEYKDFVSTVP